ncbi:MAG TPA: hypothetical protein VFU82_03305, partial [Gammaproteobacteria bacterium]|nr:hypothetical protein [Gammaproteobacteria bacterium]
MHTITQMTNLTHNKVETDKTDETVTISNSEFLTAIFGQNHGTVHPVTISFKGHPDKAAKSMWHAQPWQSPELNLPADSNNYFSLGCFNPNDHGVYRRKKEQFHALHAIMLDDINTKAPMDRLTLPPSWLLETSPDNYQAGYILAKPITNQDEATRLMRAIINANLCDPGANGPATRLARLPIGGNGKHNPAFRCHLKTWSPNIKYTTDELISGLQLDIIDRKNKQKKSKRAKRTADDNEQVWSPEPEENPIIAELKRLHLYKAPLGEGKHDITCPWVDEHTNQSDNGTAYFEPDDNFPTGGFKCLHGHCQHRHITELLQFLGIDKMTARMKPTIRNIRGEIHRIVDMAEMELAKSGRYYQRGGLIVSIHTDPSTTETMIQPTTQAALVRALSNGTNWMQYDKREKQWVRIDPPSRHTGILFDSEYYRHLLPLNGITRQPYFRLDGSLVLEAGYDAITGLFGVFDNRKYSMAECPSKDDAINALNTLKSLLSEFNFTNKADESAALCALLTAAIRPSLENAPMFHIQAHSPGSGKSYLCKVISALASPQHGTPTTFPADDAECGKLLLSELLRSPATIEFDNLTSDIVAHKTLCTALTSEHISGRILGISKMATVSTRTLFLSSGNNVKPISDMIRRCITINLNPEIENPATRTFMRPNLINEILSEREKYVLATLTIIRA